MEAAGIFRGLALTYTTTMGTRLDASLIYFARPWAILFAFILSLLFAEPSLAQTAQQYRQRAIKLSRARSWRYAAPPRWA